MTTKVPVELFDAGAGFTIGSGAAEDTKIVFDGNAQDYYVGLDDSADKLIIGVGSTVGTNPTITIDESQNFEIAGTMNLLGFTGSKSNFTNSMLISNDAGTGTLSTANNNTGFGHQVFNVLTSGDGNTGIGADALSTVTSGSNNTAVGLDALKPTTGDRNTAVGSTAADAITSGSQNVAVGYGAASSVDSGSANTAIGDSALETCTSGTLNTAVGEDALKSTTGTANTGLGVNAGENISSGSSNTCVGENAGDGITTGSNNIIIGSTADVDSGSGSGVNVLGVGVSGAAGFTTLGFGSDDIRAPHGSTSWGTVSDERVKKDIEDSIAGLSFINDLRPRIFKFKNKGDLPKEFKGYEKDSNVPYKNENVNHGFIAQEVKVAIDNHSEIKDGFKFWDVRDTGQQEVAESALIPILTKAVQELSEKCDFLQNEINELKGN